MKIKYLPTGNVFDLPEAEARRIYVEDRGNNYKILDGKIELEPENIEKTTVFDEIVETEEKTTEGETEEKEKPLAELTKEQLKAKLTEMGIEYPKNAKKEELLVLFKDDGTTEGE